MEDHTLSPQSPIKSRLALLHVKPKFAVLGGIFVFILLLIALAVFVLTRSTNLDQPQFSLANKAEYNSQLILVAKGGVVGSEDQLVHVTLPEGASDKDLTVAYHKVSDEKRYAESRIGPMYELHANDADGNTVSSFNKPLSIETVLSDAEINQYGRENIATYFFNEKTQLWEKLPGKLEGNKLTAYTDHFTLFTTAGNDPNSLHALAVNQQANTSPSVVVDDSDPPPFFQPGEFSDNQPSLWLKVGSGYKGDALYTGNSINSRPHNWATWKGIAITGSMPVTVTIPSPSDSKKILTREARYVVTYANGQTTTVKVDQQANRGKTVLLGTFLFDGVGSVYLSDVVSETATGKFFASYIVFDAVSFGAGIPANLDITPPEITKVKAQGNNGVFVIEANITDDMSGVGKVELHFGNKIYPMKRKGVTSIYSGTTDPDKYAQGDSLNYQIYAWDNAGNLSIWDKTRGYIFRGSMAKNSGLPPWVNCGDTYRQQSKPPCPNGNKCNYQCAGDPVNTFNGNLVEKDNLIDIPGRPEIDLHLTYNSQGGEVSIFGENWTHSYNYHLVEMDNADFQGAFVQYPDGRILKFTGSNFQPEAGYFEKLTKTAGGYELVFTDLSKIKFDSDGEIVRGEDANGNGLTFTYGQKTPYTLLSQITNIKADGGREINFQYNGQGLVSKITAAEGKTVSLEYNSTDDLTKIIDAKGGQTVFEYTDHNLTRKVSPAGYSYFVNTFDGNRRVTSQIAGASYKETFTYDSDQTKVTDANGKTITYKFTNGLLTDLTDATGKTLSYQYNSDNKIIALVDRDGNRYEFTYDSKGNQLTSKDPLGFTTTRTFDTTFNKPTSEVFKQADHITNSQYDSKGNLVKVTDANGNSASYVYDNFGQLAQSVDFNGNTTKYTYNTFGDLAQVTDAANTVQKFGYDGLGRMTFYINGRGVVYATTYDLNNNVVKIAGPVGYVLGYEYDANNRKTKEIDANGGNIKYTYDNSENLLKMENQLGFATTYTYGPMNEKLTMTDAEGRIAKYSYDDNYNLITETQAAGTANEAVTKYTYNNTRYVTSTTDPENRVTKYELDAVNRIRKQIQNANNNPADSENNVVTEYVYSPTGALIKQIDANGNTTDYQVDKLDRVIKITDAEGQSTGYKYDPQGNLIEQTNPRSFATKNSYDVLNRLADITDAKGGVTRFAYDGDDNIVKVTDANGVTTNYAYNELDRVAAKIENFISGGVVDEKTNVKTTLGYDLYGSLTSYTNPRGITTKFNYDAAHRNTSIVDGVGSISNSTFDKVNNILVITDRNGHNRQYNYDSLNRVVKSIDPEGNTQGFSYDKVGNNTKFINARGKAFTYNYDPLNRQKVATDALGKTEVNAYDRVGNVLSFTDENGHTDNYQYDKVYRVTKYVDAENFATAMQYDANGNLIKRTDGNGNPTSFAYDEIDRLISQTDAENEVQSFDYDKLANRTQLTEADGTQHQFAYDPLYRLITVVDNFKPSQQSNSDTNVTTKYNYDANGNLVATINPLGRTTKFEYDALDRTSKETNPLNNIWQYGYDKVGNMTKRIDANGATTQYNYYPDDQLQQITYPTYKVAYTYSETNFPTQMTDNLGKTVWKYDDLDRMVSQQDPLNRPLSYQYDGVGNVTKLTYPDSRTVSNTYLKNDWLQKTANSDNNEVVFARDGVGMPVRLDRTNSSYSQVKYDKVYRPVEVNDQQVGSGDHLISKFNYNYNKIGNVTQQTAEYGWRQPSKVVSNYKYDGLHRLTVSNSDDDQATNYTYDAAGNRTVLIEKLKKGPETRRYTFNEANELTNIDINSPMPPNVVKYQYKYDGNGNRIDQLVKDNTGVDRGVSYSYDFENRMLVAQDYKGQLTGNGKATKGGNTTVNNLAHTDMAYDGNGRRLVSAYFAGGSNEGKRTEYTYDRLDPVVETSMWNNQRNNMYRDSAANLLFYQEFKSEQAPSGTLYWYHYDGEGNIAGTTKDKAQSDHTYRYDEYGSVLPENGNWTAPHNQYTLSQKQYDGNTNLYYFGARYYDAVSGTWTTQDSYRGQKPNPMSMHRYMYNNDSPINFVDKYGFTGVNCSVESHPDCQPQPSLYNAPGFAPNSTAQATYVNNSNLDWNGDGTVNGNDSGSVPLLSPGVHSTIQVGVSTLDAGVQIFNFVRYSFIGVPSSILSGNSVGVQTSTLGAFAAYDSMLADAHDVGINTYNALTNRGPIVTQDSIMAGLMYDVAGADGLQALRTAKQGNRIINTVEGAYSLGKAVVNLSQASEVPQVLINRYNGTQTAEDFANFLRSNGYNVAGEEISVGTPVGLRRYDIVIRNADGTFTGIEVKSGNAARSSLQLMKDNWVTMSGQNGSPVCTVGNSASTLGIPHINNVIKVQWSK